MDHRGMTLIELMVAGGVVFVVLCGLTYSIATTGDNVWARTDTLLAAMTPAQQAINRITEDLHAATLAQPVTCAAGDLQFTRKVAGADRAIRYQLDAATGMLSRTEGLNPAQVVAANISALTFPTCNVNGVVQLSLTARVVPRRGPVVIQTLASQVLIRHP